MSVLSKEDIDRIVVKWSNILDFKDKPLSEYKSTVILIESQEQWFSRYDGKRFSSFEEREAYDKEFLDINHED